jgi:hypothetical protein
LKKEIKHERTISGQVYGGKLASSDMGLGLANLERLLCGIQRSIAVVTTVVVVLVVMVIVVVRYFLANLRTRVIFVAVHLNPFVVR